MSGVIDFRTPAAGFDRPIEMWLACHDRVLRMLNLLVRLRDHVAAGESAPQAAITATSILRYFDEAAPLHHEDEETDLFPRLLANVAGQRRPRIARLVDELRAAHADLDAQWAGLRGALVALEAGTARGLDAQLVDPFVAGYATHVDQENTWLAPEFAKAFDRGALEEIGRAMAARRGVDWDELVAR